ncbi:class I SAM-dependent methyltransferase [Vibrio variabilis]|uniref:class I SAM-dependent methyltransferase n=1 Tax=Vibrio variabilis TaxID=990271 RepID=UPI0013A6C2CA|nr:class I SAM-dependent methyltransferase [Vibrio variabilis]
MNLHTLFSVKSDLYEEARPSYPSELYQYLLSITPSKSNAWDCACGNGQAAESLAVHFDNVIATDVSEQQIENAKSVGNVEYLVTKSEKTPFTDNTFDLVCVAQALHWFEFDAFWPEVHRVLKPQGVFAAWGYTWPSISPEIDQIFEATILKKIEPYWAAQNRLLWDHYKDVDFPFKQLDVPDIKMQVDWSLDEFISFIQTFFSNAQMCRRFR